MIPSLRFSEEPHTNKQTKYAVSVYEFHLRRYYSTRLQNNEPNSSLTVSDAKDSIHVSV
jgi:hypothetical protein